MTQYLGEYECKVDAKGRMRLPSALLRQIGDAENLRFVVNRGFEQCLSLYTQPEWEKVVSQLNTLNLFEKKNRVFVRYFHRGATELEPDANDRILIPRGLLDYSLIEKEAVIIAFANKIEIWSKETYEEQMDDEPMDFADLAETVMGGVKAASQHERPSDREN